MSSSPSSHPSPPKTLWAKLVQKARDVWTLLWKEHTTPREISIAVAMGTFVGCTPAIGFHGWIALGLATLFKLNRIWSWAGSRISNILIYPWIVIGEIKLGHYLRFGDPMHLTEKEVMSLRGKLIVDWLIGSIPVGIGAAIVFGGLAYGLAHLRSPKKGSEDVR